MALQKKTRNEAYHLIMCDLYILDVPAKTFIDQIHKWYKKLKLEGELPLLVCHSYRSEDSIKEQMQQAGFNVYLQKPCMPDQLKSLLIQHGLI